MRQTHAPLNVKRTVKVQDTQHYPAHALRRANFFKKLNFSSPEMGMTESP